MMTDDEDDADPPVTTLTPRCSRASGNASHADDVGGGRPREDIAEPGDYVVREVAGESVIVDARRERAALQAFYNVCRHRGTRLCTEAQGKFAGPHPVPVSRVDLRLDGQLVAAPHMDDSHRASDARTSGWRPVAVAAWDGFVFVTLARRRGRWATRSARSASQVPRRGRWAG